jgi:hypothetical protein
LAGDLGDHQPMGRGYSGIEQRTGTPDVDDVVEPKRGVLEEMGGLVVDLKWLVVIKRIDIEPLVHCS